VAKVTLACVKGNNNLRKVYRLAIRYECFCTADDSNEMLPAKKTRERIAGIRGS